jgi:hypothetical protein
MSFKSLFALVVLVGVTNGMPRRDLAALGRV